VRFGDEDRPGKQNTSEYAMSRLSAQDILTDCIYGTIIPKEIKITQTTTVFIESSDALCVATFPSYSRNDLIN
jgi:hypothetical protein